MTTAQRTDEEWGEGLRASVDSTGESYHQSAISPNETPSEAVIRTVSAASGVEPTSLDIFHNAIDPDALNCILDARDNPIEVRFSFSEYLVCARNDETSKFELSDVS